MSSVNKVILIGNVGREPEVRYSQAGDPIATFSLATSEKWNSKDGSPVEKTEWHRVTVFGKTAQVVRDYVTKGKSLYIEGQIVYSDYVNKDGVKVYKTEIHVKGFNSRLVLLGSKGDSGAPPASASGSEAPDSDFHASDSDVPF